MDDHEMVRGAAPAARRTTRPRGRGQGPATTACADSGIGGRRGVLKGAMFSAPWRSFPLAIAVPARSVDVGDDWNVSKFKHTDLAEGHRASRPTRRAGRSRPPTSPSARCSTSSRRPPTRPEHPLDGEGQGRRPAGPPDPEDLTEAEDRKGWSYEGSSPTRRSARTWAARSRSTSSRPTTCCARATSRRSTSPTARRSSSARPTARCRSCRSRSTTRATWSLRATSPSPSARASGSV